MAREIEHARGLRRLADRCAGLDQLLDQIGRLAARVDHNVGADFLAPVDGIGDYPGDVDQARGVAILDQLAHLHPAADRDAGKLLHIAADDEFDRRAPAGDDGQILIPRRGHVARAQCGRQHVREGDVAAPGGVEIGEQLGMFVADDVA